MMEKRAEDARPRLGRGLAALIGEAAAESVPPGRDRGQRKVPVEFLRPNPRNPRSRFDEAELEDLTASIREKGVIQPLLARPVPGVAGAFEIIAGERRWRAAQRAGLHEVPVAVVEADDRQALELAIIENVQRADLNPLEEALGYEKLMAEFAYSQSDLARIIGKSRPHVANTLRLLKLPESIRPHVASGRLSAGHARALLAVREPEKVAREAMERDLSVRAIEQIAARESARAPEVKSASSGAAHGKDADTRALEKMLAEALGLSVVIDRKGEAGELRIRYTTLDQLDALCRRLGG